MTKRKSRYRYIWLQKAFIIALMFFLLLSFQGCGEKKKKTKDVIKSQGATLVIKPDGGPGLPREKINVKITGLKDVSSISENSITLGGKPCTHSKAQIKDGRLDIVIAPTEPLTENQNTLKIGETVFQNAYTLRPVKIKFMMWGEIEEYEAVKGYMKEFMKKFPGVKVQILHTPRDYKNKLRTMFAAEAPPDVMYIENWWMPRFIENGVLMNLSPYIKRDGFDLSLFFEKLLKEFRFNGKYYGIPKDFTTFVLIYNKDIFDRMNIPYPTKSMSWEEYLELAKKLTFKPKTPGGTKQYGAAIESQWIFWIQWAWQNGSALMNEDNTEWVLGKPGYIDKSAEAIRFYKNLVYKHHVAPTPSVSFEMGSSDMFMTGRVAMVIYGRWKCMEFKKVKSFKWEVAPLPHGKKRVGPFGTVCYAAAATTKNKEASWQLIKFLTGEPGQIAIARSGHAIPSMKKIAYSKHFVECPALIEAGHPIDNIVFLDEIKYMRPFPSHVYADEIFDKLNWKMDLIFKNNAKVKPIIEKLQPEIEHIMRQGK